jgi:hypothetical protein
LFACGQARIFIFDFRFASSCGRHGRRTFFDYDERTIKMHMCAYTMLAMARRLRMDWNHVFVRIRVLVVFGRVHSMLVLQTFLWLGVMCGDGRVANVVVSFRIRSGMSSIYKCVSVQSK